MKFIPVENIVYKTKLDEDEVLRRMHSVVESKQTFRFSFFGTGKTKPYRGEIKGSEFRIERIISYRNSFLPRITGVTTRISTAPRST